jgi:hypothetical protein
MRHGHIMAIDRIAGRNRLRLGIKMGDNLMPIKIEIDPMVRTPAFATAQNPAIKGAGGIQIMHGKSKVKGSHAKRDRPNYSQGKIKLETLGRAISGLECLAHAF